jgi:predicted SprT family Zn-dependent metalloprotease
VGARRKLKYSRILESERRPRYPRGIVQDLAQLFRELNETHFRSELPLPRLSWNPRLSSTAGRFCPGSRNPLRPRVAHIEVAGYLRDLPDGAVHVRDTMLHEMIHYVLWFRRRPHGHTAEFHEILRRVGAKRYNTVPKERAWKHWYECPACGHGFHTRRLLGVSACAKCCERHNRGQYHDRYRLHRRDPRPELALAPRVVPAVPEPPPVPRLTPAEIIRRLEELKNLVRAKV